MHDVRPYSTSFPNLERKLEHLQRRSKSFEDNIHELVIRFQCLEVHQSSWRPRLTRKLVSGPVSASTRRMMRRWQRQSGMAPVMASVGSPRAIVVLQASVRVQRSGCRSLIRSLMEGLLASRYALFRGLDPEYCSLLSLTPSREGGRRRRRRACPLHLHEFIHRPLNRRAKT